MRAGFGAVLAVACAVATSASAVGLPAHPADPVDSVLEAFGTHALVAIGDSDHNNAQLADFWQRLIHDPRFAATVDDIVFEPGNARYQDIVDRFVAGGDVPYDELRKMWQDGWQPTELWDMPVYEDLYRAVREINARLPAARRLRVILGQPPLDWSAIRSGKDLDDAWDKIVREEGGSDGRLAKVIDREVLGKGRRALMLLGGFHMPHHTTEDSNWAGEKWLVPALEKETGTRVFSVWMANVDLTKIDPTVATWAAPSIVPLRDTSLGAAPFSFYDAEFDGYTAKQRESFSRAFQLDLPMQEQFDALLYLGPPSSLTKPLPSSTLCADKAYVQMRIHRTRMRGDEDWSKRFAERCAQLTAFSDIAGIWQQRAYGQILQISPQEAVLYDTTDISCIASERIPLAEVNDTFERIQRTPTRLELYQAGGVTRYTYDRLFELPARCRLMGEQHVKDPVLTFEVFWHAFAENYAFFKLRGIDWNEFRARYSARIDATTTDQQLFEIFSEIIAELRDGHVSLWADGRRFSSGRPGELTELWMARNGVSDRRVAAPQFRKAAEKFVVHDILADKASTAANGLIIWGWAAPGIGYIDVTAMSMDADANGVEVPRERQLTMIDDAMTRAMLELGGAKALVVDARFNGGGYDAIGLQIAGYFANEKHAALTKKAVQGETFTETETLYVEPRGTRRFNGHVYLLQGNNTKSAAEIFTMGMQALPNVTRIGTPTYGVLSDALHKLLPNGWEVSLSNEVYLASDGKLYEGTGVPPDVLVTPDPSLDFAARVRLEWDAAMAMIGKRSE